MKRCKYKTLFSPKSKIASLESHPAFNFKYQEFFHSHKTSLETLLYLIKSAQISILSNKNKSKNIIIFLLELKKNLDEISKHQNLKLNYFTQEIINKKNSLRNETFENDLEENEAKNNINGSSFQKLKLELNLLKLQNFLIVQNIEEIQNKTNKMIKDYNYIKLCIPYNYFDERENWCLEQKYFPLIIKLMNNRIMNAKKRFNNTLFTKEEIDDEIETISNYICQLKINLSKIKGDFWKKDIFLEDYKNNTNNITRYNTNGRCNTFNISSGKKITDEEKNDNLIIFGKNNEFNYESEFSEKSSSEISHSDFKKSTLENCSQKLVIKLNMNKEKFSNNDENISYFSEQDDNNYINSYKKQEIIKNYRRLSCNI